MFSFFKKETKKSSPSSSPESDSPIPSNNDFVMVNDPRQGGANPNPNQAPYPTAYPTPYPLYPNFGQHFGGLPAIPPVSPSRPPFHRSESIHPTNYVQDIPFKLSSELSLGNSDEITRIQVEDILSLITSRMGVTQTDYDFTLERSLLREADTTDSSVADAPPADEEPEEE
ncbi:uncharacterized protein LOC129565759 [Sitodiplosis mosellana]|uniref:uncharacterized protein LOC129565759 n=1 Tax=Sitodiplosis mosellana TaxID=263140 RepID=UPI0024450ADF|nr:uncharacterized protein LOC129565759 [Sitodiplosis mosellana]